jgi:hypothetical protein
MTCLPTPGATRSRRGLWRVVTKRLATRQQKSAKQHNATVPVFVARLSCGHLAVRRYPFYERVRCYACPRRPA